MSILLYKQPKTLDFAGNHLFFQMKGTDYILVQGVRAYLHIKIDKIHQLASGDLFYIKMMNVVHCFKWLSTDAQAEEAVLPVNHIIRYSFASKAADFMNGMVNYAPFSDYYDITVFGDTFWLRAKNNGPLFNIDFDVSNGLPAIYYGSLKLPGIAQVNRPDYHFSCSLFVEKMSATGTYFELPEFRIDSDDNQISEIDIAGIIRRKFLNFFDLPDFGAVNPVKTSFSKLSYYITLREMSGDTVIDSITTPLYYVVNGRINNADHGSFVLRDWVVSNKRFLTNTPRITVTYVETHNLLYYLNPYSGTSTIRVKVLISHTGGDDINYGYSVASLAQDDVVMIPLGGIIANQGVAVGTIQKFICWVEDPSGTLLAGKQTYVVRPKPLFGRCMLMMNCFGMFDAVTIHTQKNQLKTEAEENILTLKSGYSRYVGDKVIDFTDGEDLFTAETGPITHEMAIHIKELLSLRRVVFLQSSDRYIRVVIEPGTTAITDEEKDLCNISFKYKPAFSGDMISQTIELPKAVHRDHSDEYVQSDYQ